MSNKAEISEAVHAILKSAAELSAAHARLTATPDLTPAERDYAMLKTIEAFRRFEAGAKAIREPVRVTLNLAPAER